MKVTFPLIACVTLAAIAGCHGESSRPAATGKGTVRAINAISTSPRIDFLIEERPIANLTFSIASGGSEYDDLSYTFNFEALLAGGTTATRIASQPLTVVKDTDYTFVVSGSLDAPAITVWERARPDVDVTGTTSEVEVGHFSPATASFDAYLLDPATAPAVGNELGSLAFGEILPATNLEAGDFVLTLTSTGDPSTVLFQSEVISVLAGNAIRLVVFDTDTNDLSDVSVQRSNLGSGVSVPVIEAGVAPVMRFFHAALDTGATDIYVDDPLTTPLLANHAFGDISADTGVPTGAVPLTYTTAGNIGSIVVDSDVTTVAGARSFVYLVENSANEASAITLFPDLRSIATVARFWIINTAANDSLVDVFAVKTGESIDGAVPIINDLGANFPPVEVFLTADDYDIYVVPEDETIASVDALPFTAVHGNIDQLIIYENADPTVIDAAITQLP